MNYDELKKKSRNFLNTNHSNNNHASSYYLLNYDWFKKYIELNNMTTIFKLLMSNNIIQRINNYDALKEGDKFNMIIKEIENKFVVNDFEKDSNYFYALQNAYLFN
jgi:hypothetical protein